MYVNMHLVYMLNGRDRDNLYKKNIGQDAYSFMAIN